MMPGRVVIIPFLQGKLTDDGTLIEPDMDDLLEQWLGRHPEFDTPDRNYEIIRATTFLEGGISTLFARVTADASPDLMDYDPAEDADLYEAFLPESEGTPTEILFHKIWTEQCEAVDGLEAQHGTDKAMGYLIGEKLLNFLEVAERKPEWRAEIPAFVAEIKRLFEPWQIAQFFETPRRLGVFGHVTDDEGHQMLQSQLTQSEKARNDARNLMLFEWARDLLMGEGAE